MGHATMVSMATVRADATTAIHLGIGLVRRAARAKVVTTGHRAIKLACVTRRIRHAVRGLQETEAARVLLAGKARHAASATAR